MKVKRYALFSEFWGYCVHAEYPAQWLLHIDGTEALHFPTRKAALRAAMRWADGCVHLHVIRVR